MCLCVSKKNHTRNYCKIGPLSILPICFCSTTYETVLKRKTRRKLDKFLIHRRSRPSLTPEKPFCSSIICMKFCKAGLFLQKYFLSILLGA